MTGKPATCTRCGSSQAEYYSTNYIHCDRCDKSEAGTNPTVKSLAARVAPWQVQFYLQDPRLTEGYAFYRCVRCATKLPEHVDDVANGLCCCMCGGKLVLDQKP